MTLPAQLAARHPRPLSPGAVSLLGVLRQATEPLTDRTLAAMIGTTEREVIDLRDELLDHGYWVVSSCKAPFGSTLTTDRKAMEGYIGTLTSRGVKILARRRRAKQALQKPALPPAQPGQQLALNLGGAGILPAVSSAAPRSPIPVPRSVGALP